MRIANIVIMRASEDRPYRVKVQREQRMENVGLFQSIYHAYYPTPASFARLLLCVNTVCEIRKLETDPEAGYHYSVHKRIDPDQIKTCPRCFKKYSGHPALSRRDNSTSICSQCGIEEALVDAGGTSVIGTAFYERDIRFQKVLKEVQDEHNNTD